MRNLSVFGTYKSFSAEENRILESLVKDHQDVVESKDNNDTAMWDRKVDTWKRIGVEFELQSKTNRPWPALWEKYLSNRLNCVVATSQSDKEESNRDLESTGGSSRSSSEPQEQEQSTSITSPVALEDERIKLLAVAQDYYKSESSKHTGKWKVKLEKIRIDSERRRMESTKELLKIDRQLAELQNLANHIIYT